MSYKIIITGLLFFCLQLSATHNRSGEILYKRIAPYSFNVGPYNFVAYNYSITVIKYFDDGPSVADRCEDTVDFGDGVRGVAQRINGSNTCGCLKCGVIIFNDGSYRVKKSVYTTTHNYSGPGSYVVSSTDPNRSAGVNNIPLSDQVPFSIQSLIVVKAGNENNSSPVLFVDPIYKGLSQTCYNFNAGAFDVDGDSLSYQLVPCNGAPGQIAAGYFDPPSGSSGSFSVNNSTGMISWCKPQLAGMYNIALRIFEWRRADCSTAYQLNGYVTRDMQILIFGGAAANISFNQGFSDICLVAGTTITRNTSAAFSPSQSISQLALGYTTDAATWPKASFTSSGSSGLANGIYNWTPSCNQIRKTPYQVIMVYELQNQTFQKEINIRVVPPAPLVSSISNDTNKITLHWNKISACINPIRGYNIYRRIGTNNWTHGACETGLPASSGYQLIASVTANDTLYTDDHFIPSDNNNQAYYFVTTVMTDCSESFAENVKSSNIIVGLKTISGLGSARIYPNPFSDQLEIDLPINQPVTCLLYASDGALVYNSIHEPVNGKIILQMEQVQKGFYLLRLQNNQGLRSEKIVRH